MKILSEQKALDRLDRLKSNFKSEIAENFEHRAKSCLTCETQGACCLDAHFVNVHISHLEAVSIRQTVERFSKEKQREINDRINETIARYDLKATGDTFAQTFACPLFEKGTGCLVHNDGKPLACITHACYENKTDLPPDELQIEQEKLVDELNKLTYGRPQTWMPLPVAIRRCDSKINLI